MHFILPIRCGMVTLSINQQPSYVQRCTCKGSQLELKCVPLEENGTGRFVTQRVYDRFVHYTDAEYKALTGLSVGVQALVERPYIHLLAADSSSALDHIAFTVQRSPTYYVFQWRQDGSMDRGGIPSGGNYKCGSWVYPVSHLLMPHAATKSLVNAQAHVLAGVHGGRKNCVKPFNGFSVHEVRTS